MLRVSRDAEWLVADVVDSSAGLVNAALRCQFVASEHPAQGCSDASEVASHEMKIRLLRSPRSEYPAERLRNERELRQEIIF